MDPAARFSRALAFHRGDGAERSLSKFTAELRLAARGGHAEAQWWLGALHEEGLKDARGRPLVQKNRAHALRWYTAAAEQNHAGALLNLGVLAEALDPSADGKALALALYERAYRAEPSAAGANNIATVHRDRRDFAAAVRWWRRATAAGDDGAWIDIGYAHQHGIGARRSRADAVECYERALRSERVTTWEREEAMYHLALVHVGAATAGPARSRARSLARARALLEGASADADFPEAAHALTSLGSEREAFCTCRRGRAGAQPGNADCPRHRRRGRAARAGR